LSNSGPDGDAGRFSEKIKYAAKDATIRPTVRLTLVEAFPRSHEETANSKVVITNVATPTMEAPNWLNPDEPAEQSLHTFSRSAPTSKLSPAPTNPARRHP
jgi:hypothetical protein